jgi:energy-coupling factor transport system permease protein
VTYQHRASPLHVARAAVGCLWCAALAAIAFAVSHPVVLAGVLVASLAAASAARVGEPVVRVTLRLGLPLAVFIAVLNPTGGGS